MDSQDQSQEQPQDQSQLKYEDVDKNESRIENETFSRIQAPVSKTQNLFEPRQNKDMDRTFNTVTAGLNSGRSQLPLTSAVVVSSLFKETLVKSYVTFKIVYTWNSNQQEISRRFSDFKALRHAICNILPFTYVFPVHKKKLLVR